MNSVNRRDFVKTGAAAATAAGFAGCMTAGAGNAKLAFLGGTPIVSKAEAANYKKLFHWPIVNDAMRKANDRVLCAGTMSGWDIADEFERKFAAWNGTKYASSAPNGTASLIAAFYAIGLGPGDELICPSITYWASCLGAIHLGATVVFADIDPETLTLDPKSFEAHITPRTKAVVPVHVYGQPCDMDPIMAIAKKHGIKVVEDVSHAQGGLYKGRKLGTIGDCGAMSLMSSKSFAIGEGGMLVTNDKEIYRRVVRWGQYERIKRDFTAQEIVRTNNLPFGGVKNRLNQCSAAIGIEQLKKYDAECEVICKAMEYYHDGIKDVKGITKIYPKWENSNKAGWYYSRSLYNPEAFDGVSVETFVRALNCELSQSKYGPGCNFPLHTSNIFDDADIFGNGNPPSKRFLPAGVTPKGLTGHLPVAESILPRVIGDPMFKLFEKEHIDKYIEAVHKVAANTGALRDWEKKNSVKS